MTFSEFILYFRTAAVNNKRLAHDATSHPTFYEIDIEQILSATKLESVDMSMLIECPEYRPSDAKSNNIRKMTTGAFLIVQEVEISNIQDREAKLNETFIVAEQVVSKIVNDEQIFKINRSHPNVIKGFDPNSLYFQKVGPIVGNHYGWRVEFAINDTFTNGLQLQASEWNNETPYKDLV